MLRITTKILLLLIYLRNTKREDGLPQTQNRVNIKEILLVWCHIHEFKASDYKQTLLTVKNTLSIIFQVIGFSGVLSKGYLCSSRHVGVFPFFPTCIN